MTNTLHLFEGFGIELEYMITSRHNAQVLPIADQFFKRVCGNFSAFFETEKICFSNELVLHVLELKTNGPAASLEPLPALFADQIQFSKNILAELNATLMPSAMHPLMNPLQETKLWPHENNEIYEMYNRIFGCQGHGWANLQATHINLPFANDQEFAALHTAIRLLLPLMPALTASSPLMEGHLTSLMDTRLEVYARNQKKIPAIIGQLIPEPVLSKHQYQTDILQKIYDDIEHLDPEKIISHEWLNSRAAIARFERMAIEIRLLDIQECPLADLAIASLIVETIRFLVQEESVALKEQADFSCSELCELLWRCIRNGEKARINNDRLLGTFNIEPEKAVFAGDFWHIMFSRLANRIPTSFHKTINTILQEGCLARRITNCLGKKPNAEKIIATYRKLSECLSNNTLFETVA